jgi:hypothetical protein
MSLRGNRGAAVVSKCTRVAAALNFDGFGAGRDALTFLHERVRAAADARAPVPLAAAVAA